MIINDIVEAYKIMKKGTDFMHKCAKRNITREDLEGRTNPEIDPGIRNYFSYLEAKGKSLMMNQPGLRILTCQLVAYPFHRVINGKKIKEMSNYTQSNILNQCSLR